MSQLVTRTAKSAPPALNVADTGDVLYRMVVPAKVAAQVGKGLVKPMAAKAYPGAVYTDLVGSGGIVAKATLVPVAGKAAVAGAATGSAATAGAAVASAGALTVAAPLVLMAVAVSVSAHADHQRQESIERTRRRLDNWQKALDALPEDPVEIGALRKAFPGITEEGGTFRAHLELAKLAIALKRRVLVLQAVEHAQLEGASHPFTTFVRTLQDDERRVDELESGITSILLRLPTLELKRRGGFRSIMFSEGRWTTFSRLCIAFAPWATASTWGSTKLTSRSRSNDAATDGSSSFPVSLPDRPRRS